MNLDDSLLEDLALEEMDKKPREPEKINPRATSYLGALIESYEKEISWDNGNFYRHRRLLYAKFNLLARQKSDSNVKGILEWIRGKKLHPLAIVKIVNRELTKV